VRLANRAAERLLLSDHGDISSPDWRPVLQHGTEILAEKSKDMEITAYVIEALIRLHGFAGLRDGFRLARELVQCFWDDLYPLPDEDGLETRLAPLAALNGTDGEGALIGCIWCVPLTQGAELACYHFQQAFALSQTRDEVVREKRRKEGAVGDFSSWRSTATSRVCGGGTPRLATGSKMCPCLWTRAGRTRFGK
jgi:type VI secretion system protein ImpA